MTRSRSAVVSLVVLLLTGCSLIIPSGDPQPLDGFDSDGGGRDSSAPQLGDGSSQATPPSSGVDAASCNDSTCAATGTTCHPKRCATGACVDVTPLPKGTSCSGTGDVCDGEGSCVECLTSASCDAASTTPICNGTERKCAKCGTVADCAGNQAGTHCQPSGACGEALCNETACAASGTTCQPRKCTPDKTACIDSTATSAETPCSGGICDGFGACVECLSKAQCPTSAKPICGTDRKCRGCGTLASDCASNPAGTFCQPSGACGSTPCVANTCSATGTTCQPKACTTDSVSCLNSNPASAQTPCTDNGGAVCNGNGMCVGCVNNSNCTGASAPICGAASTCRGCASNNECMLAYPSKPVCSSGACVAATCNSTTCAASGNTCQPKTCSSDTCVNANPAGSSTPCSESGGTVCNGSGTCVGCLSNANCTSTSAPICNTASSSCRGCTSNPECANAYPSQPICSSGACVATTCVPTTCAATGTTCQPRQCSGATCVNATPAAAQTACTESGGTVCNGSGSCVGCLSNTQCTGTAAPICGASSTCRACASSSECSSAYPSKPICSSGACVADTCVPATCAATGTTCQPRQCSAGSCVNAAPTASQTACTESGGKVCNGSGSCVECTTSANCATPPTPVCSSATMLKTSAAPATCSSGTCSYTETFVMCPNGCSAGACQGTTYIDITAGLPAGSGQQPSALIDSANGKLLVATYNGQNNGKPWLYLCDLDGSNCTNRDISAGQGTDSGWEPRITMDLVGTRFMVVTRNYANSQHASAFRCQLGGTGCTHADISAGQGAGSGATGTPLIVGPRLLVPVADATNSNRLSLHKCTRAGDECAYFNISVGTTSSQTFSPSMLFEPTTNKLVIFTPDTPRLFRANPDLTGAEELINLGYPPGTGLSPSAVLDSSGNKLLVAVTNGNDGNRLGLVRCNLDGTGCTLHDISAGQPANSGLSPSAGIDPINNKLVVAVHDQANSGKPSLIRCNLDGTSCTREDISAGQGTNSGLRPSLVVDAVNRRILVVTSNETPSGKRLGLFLAPL